MRTFRLSWERLLHFWKKVGESHVFNHQEVGGGANVCWYLLLAKVLIISREAFRVRGEKSSCLISTLLR